jgi:hypothetical protein
MSNDIADRSTNIEPVTEKEWIAHKSGQTTRERAGLDELDKLVGRVERLYSTWLFTQD